MRRQRCGDVKGGVTRWEETLLISLLRVVISSAAGGSVEWGKKKLSQQIRNANGGAAWWTISTADTLGLKHDI